MKFVLKCHDGYFAGERHDGYGGVQMRFADNVSEAKVFTASVDSGQVAVTPDLPEGDWAMVPIRITVEVGC